MNNKNKWNKKERLYYKLYITFYNDDDYDYENYFISNGLNDVTNELFYQNILHFIKHILNCGKTVKDIIKYIPETEPYLKELNTLL